MLNISIRPEYIFFLFGFPVTNSFFTAVIVSCFLIFFAFLYRYAHEGNSIADYITFSCSQLLRLINNVTNDRKLSRQLFPLIATFFIFILTANIFELLPGFLGAFFINNNGKHVPFLRSPNSDLTITLALAIISVAAIQYFSFRELGWRGYTKRFIDLTNPVTLILGFFELLSEFVKILSFSFRLYGNLFAGEVLLLVIAFLVPYIIPIPFMFLEVFIGIIQAFIFAILTLTFIKVSCTKNNESFS